MTERNVQLRMPLSLLKRLDHHAVDYDVPRQTLIIGLLKAGLDAMDDGLWQWDEQAKGFVEGRIS